MVFAHHFWNLLGKQSLTATLRFGTPQAPTQGRKEHARPLRLAVLQLLGCAEALDLKPYGLNKAQETMGLASLIEPPLAERTGMWHRDRHSLSPKGARHAPPQWCG
jgi:hypothetical protein